MTRAAGVRVDLRPDRTWAPAGSVIRSAVTVDSDRPRRLLVTLELLDLDRVVASTERRIRTEAATRRLRLGVPLPAARRHGYGLGASVRGPDGSPLASASSAVEAIEGWWESPRHAALIEYRDAADGARRAQALRDWHVTVVQAYDWMWRHYRYTPPDDADAFTDTLGQPVSHAALRAAMRGAGAVGIATLAYGSVYGAEREYVDRHPDDRVFDAAGEPLSLGGTFFINDVRPGTHWRETLLAEYERAMRAFPFAGIHMDTYGPPWTAVAADGESMVFRELYPGLIEEAAERVTRIHYGRVLFNCVEGFPLEDVALAPMAALYLELWPPDDRYRHIVEWIDRAHMVANGRAVVIAAYAAALRSATTDADRIRAIESSILLDCIILAAGAYHHTLAEGDRLIVEGYYPAAVALLPAEKAELQAAWRFSARYCHLLSGARDAVEPADAGSLRILDAAGAPVPTTTCPAAGHVWLRAGRLGGARVVQMVDLRSQVDDRWDTGRQASPPVDGWRVAGSSMVRPVAASPWTADGDALSLEPTDGDRAWVLPPFRRWLMLVEGA